MLASVTGHRFLLILFKHVLGDPLDLDEVFQISSVSCSLD